MGPNPRLTKYSLSLRAFVARNPCLINSWLSRKWAAQSCTVDDGRRQVGVLARDVEAVFPELVGTSTGVYKGVEYSRLTAVLVEAVKELKAENEALKRRIELLEKAARLNEPKAE